VNVKDALGHSAHLIQVHLCPHEDATLHNQPQLVTSVALSVGVIGVTIDLHITAELPFAWECMSDINHIAVKWRVILAFEVVTRIAAYSEDQHTEDKHWWNVYIKNIRNLYTSIAILGTNIMLQQMWILCNCSLMFIAWVVYSVVYNSA
jgi:hypothetical protein